MRRAAFVLVPLAALLTSCSSGGGAAAAPDARGRLDAARRAAGQLTTFAFRSVTELPGKQALQRTVVDGRAAVPDRVAYTVTVGDSTIEVISIAGRGYSRTLPGGHWTTERTTTSVAAPAVVLTKVLNAADNPRDRGDATFDGRRGRLLEVTLTADEVRSTGLLAAKGGSDVTVTLALDPQGRVLRLALELPVHGTTASVLRQVTTYGSFGSAAPIQAPV